MPEIVINEAEIIYKSSTPQIVDSYGRISVGRKLTRKEIIVYAVEVQR